MGSPDKKSLGGIVNFWGPWKSDTANVSRDFWMPDQSCRVCYECDTQFTVFNRRHHCRVCGRVFCAKCTAHSIPKFSDNSKSDREESERIRVCNYCFRQWEKSLVTANHETGGASSPGLSLSPSATSLGSINSSFTVDSSTSTVGSMAYSTGPYEHVTYGPSVNPEESSQLGRQNQDNGMPDAISLNSYVDIGDISSNETQYGYSVNRSDDEDNANGGYYGAVNFDEFDHMYRSSKGDYDGEENGKGVSPLTSMDFGSEFLEGINTSVNEPDTHNIIDEPETSLYGIDSADVENLDFENNGLLWIPPEPEDEDADREVELFDDEDDGDATEEWGYQSSYDSMTGGELKHKEKANEEHRRAMINMVGGHFRALISQLLQVDNLPVGEDYDNESWLDIITSLSWEAASLLKPDMSKGSGMDPGGYVKVKCLACGKRSDSVVVKGVVCKKNVAHRRMAAKFDRPRVLILGGALEYQRVSNHLSSFDTLLQQEKDHLKMAVAKISAHNPNILLVEKSVSRFAQEYLLEKNMSLVLNIKRPLLERIARCTGAQIVPSVDHLKSPVLGYCESFHVDKYFEEHGSADQGGKKLTKTLMFFEGCPKPLGCTILLKGAPGDELKKVKHVIQYGVFAAYHLALETSYLADEGASVPELPLKSPITVTLPDKPLNINRSISTITSGLVTPTTERPQSESNHQVSQTPSLITADAVPLSERSQSSSLTKYMQSCSSPVQSAVDGSLCTSLNDLNISVRNDLLQDSISEHTSNIKVDHLPESHFVSLEADDGLHDDNAVSSTAASVPLEHSDSRMDDDGNALTDHDSNNSGNQSCSNFREQNEKVKPLKEDFPPSPSDSQSILVSLTTRCVWKGVVCERAHLFRIKYYRSFDKPLGRFLLDDLFDQNYRCRVCEMPSEAHIHCYTHQQGSLTISVRKLTDYPLPGERDRKIWMWHRCLRCPRVDGFPPATRRVAMSDAAWGLSFGKFLELSFSNHAAASRVASCGHSLHKDCLRFYGCGRMVACFRYAPIIVHSVYLPPSKLEFPSDNLEWIQKEVDEVWDRTELLYAEVFNAINEISEKWLRSGSLEDNTKACELKKYIRGLEKFLKKEKEEFEEYIQKALQMDTIDILEINRLRRRLLMQSYLWDQRLIFASNLDAKISQCDSLMLKSMEETLNDVGKMKVSGGSESRKELGSCDSVISDEKTGADLSQALDIKLPNQLNTYSEERNLGHVTMSQENGEVLSHGVNMGEAGQGDSVNTVARVASAVELPKMVNLSDTLDAAWIGENYLGNVKPKDNDAIDSSNIVRLVAKSPSSEKHIDAEDGGEIHRSSSFAFPVKSSEVDDNSTYWLTPFLNIYQSFGKTMSWNAQKLDDAVRDYNPVFVTSIREMERQGGSRLLLPVGVNDIVIPIYDDEPTSIIAYALASRDYQSQTSDDPEMKRDGIESAVSLPHINSENSISLSSIDASFGPMRSFGSSEESFLSMSGSRNSLTLDPLFYTKALHARVSFTANDPLGNVKYTVTCYYAKRFEALRKISCPSEVDYIRSLSRCKKWGAQGGKSNVFFAKTLDDRFIIKQVTKTELESFIKFAPAYFKYLSESISSFSPTCLAKILGIYQVTSKHVKGGRESKMDVLVMENLLFRRNIVRLYDLKGSCRSRYNPDSSGGNKVLLDQNLIETMPTSPIFVGNKAKRLLERAIWNDTSFLASIDVMDYSLLVGIDEERRQLVVGIIDFMRQYTWDKHLETWVKASGILGGSKNAPPTVISPDQYKKRFRKAMTTYFLMVPDQWSPPTIIPSELLSDHNEESSKSVTSP